MEDAVTAPFGQCRDHVRSEWIDENQHMNLGYYVVAFDWATDLWFDHMGFDEAHRRTHGVTSFALAAFTINAAYVNHLEDRTGSIEVGKLADLIVVDRNLFAIEPAEISESQVLLTLLGGEPVHGDLTSIGAQMGRDDR